MIVDTLTKVSQAKEILERIGQCIRREDKVNSISSFSARLYELYDSMTTAELSEIGDWFVANSSRIFRTGN